MKKILILVVVLICVGYRGFSQTYFPMPSSDATWRYRFVVLDDYKDVTDFILFVDGTDTASGGQTYHKIFSRSFLQHVALSDPMPPVTDATANITDIYYGAYRESGKKIYLLSASGEHVAYDFNAIPGSAIPGYSGLITVTGIDSISLADGYHKRYLTTDTGYSVIEGVGSSRGLIPQLVSGTGLNAFMCFTHSPEVYIAPMSAGVPCTHIGQLVAESVAPGGGQSTGIDAYPVPANGVLHITSAIQGNIEAQITDGLGRQMWHGALGTKQDIDISKWPSGIYFVRVNNGHDAVSRKIIVE